MARKNKLIEKMIDDNYGKDPREGYQYYIAANLMNQVRRYHNSLKENKKCSNSWMVDDITWDDLEMDEVYQRINHTNSFIGEQMLYHKLHVLDKGKDLDLAEQQKKRLFYLKEHPQKRKQIEMQIHSIGKREESYFLSEFLMNTKLWKVGNIFIYHLLQILLVAFLLSSIILDNGYLLTGFICIALLNLMIFIYTKNRYEMCSGSLADLKTIYKFAKWMEEEDKNEQLFVTKEVKDSLRNLKRLSKLVIGMNDRKQSTFTGDAAAILSDFIWGITLMDMVMFNKIVAIIENKQDDVLCLLNFVGQIDSDIAICSYRDSLKVWCQPKFTPADIIASEVSHPLLNNSVANDFELLDRAIITGTNASGKSTFMKTLALNCILAQTICTCTARQMYLKPVQIVTCMSLRDDVISGESYYFREAKYLKRILDLIVKDSEVLIVIDEILKGTNTAERVAASKAILDYIGKTNCYALVATHDNELTQNERYKNYHFTCSIKNKDIVFDYLIHEGRNEQRNAIELLSFLEYPKIIVTAAKGNMNAYR